MILGDERDCPRGRIALIQNMLESGRAAHARNGAPPRPLPVVPGLPHRLSLGGRLRDADRHRARPYRKDVSNVRGRAHVPLGACLFVLTRPARCSRWRSMLGRMARPFAHRFPARLRRATARVPRAQTPHPRPPHRFAARSRRCRARRCCPAACSACSRRKSIMPRGGRWRARASTRRRSRTSGCCGALAFHMGKTAERQANRRAR